MANVEEVGESGVQAPGGVGGPADTGSGDASSASSFPANSALLSDGAPPQVAFAADTGNAKETVPNYVEASLALMAKDHEAFKENHGNVSCDAMLSLQRKIIALVGSVISKNAATTITASDAAAAASDAVEEIFR